MASYDPTSNDKPTITMENVHTKDSDVLYRLRANTHHNLSTRSTLLQKN